MGMASIWEMSSCFLLLCILRPLLDTLSNPHSSHVSESDTELTEQVGVVDITGAVIEEERVNVVLTGDAVTVGDLVFESVTGTVIAVYLRFLWQCFNFIFF